MADYRPRSNSSKLPSHASTTAWPVAPSNFLVRNASDTVHVLSKDAQDNHYLQTSSSYTKLADVSWKDSTEDVVEGEVLNISPQQMDWPARSHLPRHERKRSVKTAELARSVSGGQSEGRPSTPSRRRLLFDQMASKVSSPIRESSRKTLNQVIRRDDGSRVALPRPLSIRSASAPFISPTLSILNSATPSVPEDEVFSPPLERLVSPVAFPETTDDSGSLTSPRAGRLQRSQAKPVDVPARRASRRGSALSGASSMNSPASMFLSQWSRNSEDSTPQLDEEGQEFGDRGEFVIGRLLGYGGFSVVKEAHTIEDGRKVTRAVKIVRKHAEDKSSGEIERLQHEFEHEVSIWKHLHHPNILPLLSVHETAFATFCVTELNTGGTLSDLIRKHRRSSLLHRRMSSATAEATTRQIVSDPKKLIGLELAKQYIYQLACALRYLHKDALVVHRDVKLENCLVDAASKAANLHQPAVILRLCDFGMSDYIESDARDNSHQGEQEWSDISSDGSDVSSPRIGPSNASTCIAGSLPYASPEMLKSNQPLYATSSDIWAFGVVCFALLTSEMPFSHSFAPRLQVLIEKGDWSVETVRQALKTVEASCSDTEAALELLSGCLDTSSTKRWSIDRVLRCALLSGARVS